jgi:hypothetical protein
MHSTPLRTALLAAGLFAVKPIVTSLPCGAFSTLILPANPPRASATCSLLKGAFAKVGPAVDGPRNLTQPQIMLFRHGPSGEITGDQALYATCYKGEVTIGCTEELK